MKKRIRLTSIILLLAVLPAAAQPKVTGHTTVDVGRTGYCQPVTAVFELRNKSRSKLRIESVRPDCHCTTVEYPKGAIGHNGKFQIKMTYDARQLGHFDKQAAVVYSSDKKPVYLCMKGVVLADIMDHSASYPVTMGDLLLDKADLEFDDVNRGDFLEQTLHIYNSSNKVYQPNLMHLPSYLTAKVSPERLGPNRAGTITVILNSAMLHDYGLTQTMVYLAGNPGDKVDAEREIGVSVVLLPSFANVGDSLRRQVPRIRLSDEQVDIRFDGKAKRSAVINVANEGNSELDISSLQLFTGGLRVSLGKRRLAPGQKTRLKITALRDELQRVRTKPRILMITNDPAKPKVTITINSK